MEYVYQYNAANRFCSGGIPVEGQRFGYSFDDIGNRLEAARNGRFANYQPNLLNHVVEREVPGAVDIMGHAHPEAIVTVNLENTTRQDGGYCHCEVLLDNDGQAAQEEIRVVGVRNSSAPNGEDVVSELTGETFLPADPEIFIYDDDGNLLGDGRWTYEWDAENRLVAMETRSELDETVTVFKSYLWGLDLSGTFEGAGGVGGLLAIRDHVGDDVFYPVSDGNGNVTALIDSVDAIVVGLSEYGPFGESIRATGPVAEVNPFRFSAKYFDTDTGLYYYDYRYYSPSMGRFFNRDPIEEQGGLNLYGFVRNDPVNRWDYGSSDFIVGKG